jgi:hypothetical protein
MALIISATPDRAGFEKKDREHLPSERLCQAPDSGDDAMMP